MRIHYEQAIQDFITPHGNIAHMHYRLETNDWNTIQSSMAADEYHLKENAPQSGLAVDIGSHIGSVGIAMAMDNPDLIVLCIEPVPENVTLLRLNIQENNLTQQVMVLPVGVAGPDVDSTKIRWRYQGSENANHHAFIGNASLVTGAGATGVAFEEEEVPCISISEIVRSYGEIGFLKMDCEGCEWSALEDTSAVEVPIIVGEWHPCNGKTQTELYWLLDKTHVLTFEGPPEGPGGFKAVKR